MSKEIDTKAPEVAILEDVRQTADHEKIVASLADQILPGVELNTDPAFERALVRKLDRRLLLMMMG